MGCSRRRRGHRTSSGVFVPDGRFSSFLTTTNLLFCRQAQLWGALHRSDLVTSALGGEVPASIQWIWWVPAVGLQVVTAVAYFLKVRTLYPLPQNKKGNIEISHTHTRILCGG